MKNNLIALAATICAALAIGQPAMSQTSVTTSRISAAISKPVTVDGEQTVMSIKVTIDAPAATLATSSPTLYKNITAWMSGEAKLPASSLKNQAALKQAVTSRWNAEKNDPYEEEVTILKIFENSQFVTFEVDHTIECYNSGRGLQGATRGATFRKSDGRIITWANFANTTALRKTISYSLTTWGEDDGYIRVDPETYYDEYDDRFGTLPGGKHILPLPYNPPYLTKKGWHVIYEKYAFPGSNVMWCDLSNISPTL